VTTRRVAFVAVIACALAIGPASAQTNLASLQDEAVAWLQSYIRINTVNPPGNEIAGARFLAGILEKEGIKYEIAESAPGRGNLWARLPGGGEPALVLLHHIDVVPADARFWVTDPLSGEVRDGFIYGRGALDTKSLGILQLAAFVALHRSKTALARDVVLMATADEEAGGDYGVGWLVKNRPELFKGVGAVLNEGGSGQGGTHIAVEVTQKVPYWFRLTARGEPGHGSRPREASAVTRLVAGLERLRRHEFEPRIVPSVDTYFKGIAPAAPQKWRSRFANMAASIRTPGVLEELQRDNPSLHALLRNTCSMTRLGGSDKINVVPAEAWAEIDCRLLPDQNPQAFLNELRGVLGDEINVDTIMGFTPASSSPSTPFFGVMRDVSGQYFPGLPVVPAVMAGFTDSHFVRDLGIPAYGFSPVSIPEADAGGVHGNNERISVENIRRGVAMMIDILQRFAAK